MSHKQISFDKELNEKILKGISIIGNAVGATLGPKGRTVIIKDKNRKPFITKDGVSVAKSIDLEDPFENLAAQILKQASESTVLSAGDGTTTSMIIAKAIVEKAQQFLEQGQSPVDLKKGIDFATKEVVKILQSKSKPISTLEQIEQVATISANGDKGIGKLISIAVDKVGRDGAITIQESRSSETSLDVTEGFTFESGLLANPFITDERRGVCRYEDCLVLVTDRTISTIDEILPILELAARDGRPFVIVAEQVEGQALAALIMNAAKGTMKVTAIKAPYYGEERRNVLDDLAVILGAKFVSRESGLQFKYLQLKDLGTAKIVESSKLSTTIVSNGNAQVEVDKRIGTLKLQVENQPSIHEAQKVQSRVTRLSSGIAIIKVGGLTEVEMIEKKHRIEDALLAVSSAQSEGIIAGGGIALFRASLNNFDGLSDIEDDGIWILKQAIREPFKKIIENAGFKYDEIFKDINQNDEMFDWGFDVMSGTHCNLINNGIIDPTKVTRTALENAVSAATTLLNSSVAIVET